MRINDIDVDLYLTGFDPRVVEAARQFIASFGCCSELVDYLGVLKKQRLEEARIEAEATPRERKGRPRASKQVINVMDLPDMYPIGFHSCGGLITGEATPRCEREVSNRMFYSECDSCDYWSELVYDKETKSFVERGG